jgi:sugar phosphate isomerase/epimerase
MSGELTRREWLGAAMAGLASGGLGRLAAAGGAAAGAEAGAEKAGPAGGAVAGAEARADAGAAKVPPFVFYAMDTGLAGPDVPAIEAKVKLAARLGYAGIDFGFNRQQLPRMLEELDKAGLALWGLYTSPAIEDPLDAALADAFKLLKGRKTRVELAMRSKSLKPSDPQGDPKAADLLRRASDAAADTGPVISVYPHTGCWAERVEDGLRLARQVGRKNVGANFNLVHYKWVKPNPPLEPLLREALPHLATVTINGLAGDKIVSLDRGDYDLLALLTTLKKVGYAGPVGLQAWSVPGPSEEHLSRSMNKWKELMKKLQEA